MVPFAGYSMPVQYADGIRESHLWTRSNAGLFDVSHMGQVRIHGKDGVNFLERIVVGDIKGLQERRGGLSVMTTDSGGIIDDTIVSNLGDGVFGMVINAGCKEKDVEHMKRVVKWGRGEKGWDVEMVVVEDRELLALQGPKAMMALGGLIGGDRMGGLVDMEFMECRDIELLGKNCLVTRCGYTGEDGFEISVPVNSAQELFEELIRREEVRPVGLGARDSLRLEAGLCLYGNDIDESTSPVEAGLTWTIGKRRREEGGFLGEETILKQLRDGITRRRMQFIITKGAPARGHEKILNKDNEVVGEVTSGGFSPTLNKPIGMGYCKKPWNKSGTEIQIPVRNRNSQATIKKSPLVPTHYYKVPQ